MKRLRVGDDGLDLAKPEPRPRRIFVVAVGGRHLPQQLLCALGSRVRRQDGYDLHLAVESDAGDLLPDEVRVVHAGARSLEAMPEPASCGQGCADADAHERGLPGLSRLDPQVHRRMEGHDWSGAFHRVASVAKTLSGLSQKLAFNSAKVSQGTSGMARFSGSIGHQAILGIGHRLGHSFRPWEAVRLTGYIGRAAPFLSIAGAALTVGAQLHAERREDKKSLELQKIRQDIRAEFATISASTESTFNSAWAEVIKEMLNDPLEQLIQHREELNAHRQEQNQHLQRLNEASTAANALIHRIHTT